MKTRRRFSCICLVCAIGLIPVVVKIATSLPWKWNGASLQRVSAPVRSTVLSGTTQPGPRSAKFDTTTPRTSSTIEATDRPTTRENITLADICITVKTTVDNHATRVPLILATWFQRAPNQIWFFSDTKGTRDFRKRIGHRVINTRCPPGHGAYSLSCKMGKEYEFCLSRRASKWWCHFDDDNYVNVEQLVMELRAYDSSEKRYVGRPSLTRPVVIQHRGRNVTFWFATGGAGVCVSRRLIESVAAAAAQGGFYRVSGEIGHADDLTLAFILSRFAGANLTVNANFHSHQERLRRLRLSRDQIRSQVTLSYQLKAGDVVNVPGAAFSERADPTRFLSIHCLNYPDADFCPWNNRSNVTELNVGDHGLNVTGVGVKNRRLPIRKLRRRGRMQRRRQMAEQRRKSYDRRCKNCR